LDLFKKKNASANKRRKLKYTKVFINNFVDGNRKMCVLKNISEMNKIGWVFLHKNYGKHVLSIETLSTLLVCILQTQSSLRQIQDFSF